MERRQEKEGVVREGEIVAVGCQSKRPQDKIALAKLKRLPVYLPITLPHPYGY